MELFLQFIGINLLMIVGAICVGAVIDWLTGGKILRRKPHQNWLILAMENELQKNQAAIDRAEQVLEEARKLQAEQEGATQGSTAKQPSTTSSTASTASDSATPNGSSSQSGR